MELNSLKIEPCEQQDFQRFMKETPKALEKARSKGEVSLKFWKIQENGTDTGRIFAEKYFDESLRLKTQIILCFEQKGPHFTDEEIYETIREDFGAQKDRLASIQGIVKQLGTIIKRMTLYVNTLLN